MFTKKIIPFKYSENILKMFFRKTWYVSYIHSIMYVVLLCIYFY